MAYKNALDARKEKTKPTKIQDRIFSKVGSIIPNKLQGSPESQIKSAEKKDDPLCEVCFSNPSDSVYMPCGHGGLCYDCAIDIWKTTDDCYLCREVRMLLSLIIY